jgi:1-aminocyclopropane-1-carboxylate deaminase
MQPLYNDIRLQSLAVADWARKGIRVSVLRLDLLHPIISGNKWFKLGGFFRLAEERGLRQLLSFGGAYSNHLVALAYACRQKGWRSIGIVRGERQEVLSHTLQQCISYGMELAYLDRTRYREKEDPVFMDELQATYGDCLMIPEGGFAPQGVSGASAIPALAGDDTITDWVSAVGTGTTVAGLLKGTTAATRVHGIVVLKGIQDTDQRMRFLLEAPVVPDRLIIHHEYAFAGYARPDKQLFDFMNMIWQQHQLPLDFVYTAKSLYAVYDLIAKDRFAPGSHICYVHTGGLQGNRSLSAGTLDF